MGREIEVTSSQFFLPAHRKAEALLPVLASLVQMPCICGYETATGQECPHCFHERQQLAFSAATVEDVLAGLNWTPELDRRGNIIGLSYQFTPSDRHKHDEDLYADLFHGLGPYVRAGSVIVFAANDGHRWQWTFDGEAAEYSVVYSECPFCTRDNCPHLLAEGTYSENDWAGDWWGFSVGFADWFGHLDETDQEWVADRLRRLEKVGGGLDAGRAQPLLEAWAEEGLSVADEDQPRGYAFHECLDVCVPGPLLQFAEPNLGHWELWSPDPEQGRAAIEAVLWELNLGLHLAALAPLPDKPARVARRIRATLGEGSALLQRLHQTAAEARNCRRGLWARYWSAVARHMKFSSSAVGTSEPG